MTVETQQPASPIPDEIPVSEIARPTSPKAIAEVLTAASDAGRPVLPFGGGTSLATGDHVDTPFLGLDLRGISGVREYQPADLTASFWAGTLLREVIATLGEHGQELPLDLPQAESATIGGLVATGFSGPRRLGSGSLKDLIIGAGYVRGDGLIAKAGGMLVKNVSGFEIPRLLHGSWGALAVITSINLKITPKPKADVTISRSFSSLGEALAAQATLLQRHATIAACVTEKDGDGWALRVRLLGRQASLRAQLREIEAGLGASIDEAEGDALWRDYADRWAAARGDVHLVAGGQPRTLAQTATTIAGWPGVRAMTVSVGTGSIRVRFDPAALSMDDLQGRMAPFDAARWIVESAPPAWKGDGSVWGSAPDGLDLMRAIKQEFDPAGILNRGRLFVGNR
ncbi:MAG TPA: FAD-binding oxidoreductase [Thermomicrobiales bacterium]|nr:FAD-binding oxidoreductase [Thermomicrobiales bacterium]